jgi:DNA topoisomerase-1
MQQEAYNRYKFSTSKTQSIAQRLYEGETINGEHVGLITYMRTDSTRISEDFYENHAKPFILETYGQEYLGSIKYAKKSELVQDAHEAIRPTGTHRTPELVARYVDVDEAKLYRLIYERALASLMSDKKEMQTTALFETNGLTFKATGVRTLFKGFEIVYGEFDDDDTALLPEIKENTTYEIKTVDPEQKFTKAPARYTEAKVVKLMEEKGIGRPSTYASTIKTLLDRAYVTSKGGVLTPTENGIRTTFVLNKYFPEILSTEYTANMENELDKIEAGQDTKLQALTSFYGPFMDKYTKVQEVMYKDPAQPTGELCPVCGSPLVIKKSRYGSFVACSNYPKCKYIQKEPRRPEPEVYTGELVPGMRQTAGGAQRQARAKSSSPAAAIRPATISKARKTERLREKELWREGLGQTLPGMQRWPLGREAWAPRRFPGLHQLPEMPLSRVDRQEGRRQEIAWRSVRSRSSEEASPAARPPFSF